MSIIIIRFDEHLDACHFPGRIDESLGRLLEEIMTLSLEADTKVQDIKDPQP